MCHIVCHIHNNLALNSNCCQGGACFDAMRALRNSVPYKLPILALKAMGMPSYSGTFLSSVFDEINWHCPFRDNRYNAFYTFLRPRQCPFANRPSRPSRPTRPTRQARQSLQRFYTSSSHASTRVSNRPTRPSTTACFLPHGNIASWVYV